MTNIRVPRKTKKTGERPYLAFSEGGDRGVVNRAKRPVYLPFKLSKQARQALGLCPLPPGDAPE